LPSCASTGNGLFDVDDDASCFGGGVGDGCPWSDTPTLTSLLTTGLSWIVAVVVAALVELESSLFSFGGVVVIVVANADGAADVVVSVDRGDDDDDDDDDDGTGSTRSFVVVVATDSTRGGGVVNDVPGDTDSCCRSKST
jgi:hypothetical protein